ncbi:MAG TPA: BNR-repeat neuraminidase N-terminal domain-containing protein [Bacteroidales bacterium]|nr:BNR-repeat neuraminidase N-terminal domain-containing protein [Bacteroidales bacterium]
MRTFTLITLYISIILISSLSVKGADKTLESITISQVDTFALKGKTAQPVLKINIRVTGTTGVLTLQRLVINTSNQDNSDVDSIAVYYTGLYNRFSQADYPGEAFLVDKKLAIKGDSVVFGSLSHILQTGNNYFWVTMDLSKISRASRFLDAYIKANAIKVGDGYYPSAEVKPSGIVGIADIYFKDNFESKTPLGEPVGWTQDQIDGAPKRWMNFVGGFGISAGTGHPSSPKSGNYNVKISYESYTPYKTILISKPLDLSLSARPLISFYHAQVAWCKDPYCNVKDNDELRVLYKIGENGTWNELKKYELATNNDWTKREVLFPEGLNANNVFLGFEATTKYGWGVCLDSLTIYETGVIPREINRISASNPITESVPQGSDQNPILRVNIRVRGNTGSINLSSLKVTSANTSDLDLKASGLRLFYTNDSLFVSPRQCGTAQSFSGNTATFSGLSEVLETGDNYLWVTYNIQSNANPGNLLDLKINTGDIGLSVSGTYPQAMLDPEGARAVQQTMYFDDFDNAAAWNLTGEFQIDAPLGKGGLTRGRPDPTYAYSGTKILGTDLTGLGTLLGDYEPEISSAGAYLATTSDLLDASYFKNISLQFYRYLNIDNTDTVAIEYKLEGSSKWMPIWVSDKKYIDTEWNKKAYENLSFLSRKKFNLRFRLGPTDAIDNYSGWNIDYLFLTADSIPYDVSVESFIGPKSACGLSANEHIQVRLKNTGPKVVKNFPIKLSFDGGKTYLTETVGVSIPVNGSYDYTFSTASDFSKPAIYHLIVKTAHPGDNYPDNDSIVQTVVAYPTYDLPYRSGFEKDTTFWFSYGLNNSWNEGWPSGAKINKPAEGKKCWKTDFSGYHYLYEKSYAQSPCFSFVGRDFPLIDVKFNYVTVNQLDGAVLEYSLDQGQTWKYAPEDSYPFAWNWYNDTVKTLKHKGWTGSTPGNEWVQGRQVLPSEIANQGRVQFRFAFKTDSTNTTTYEGFAFDDIKIYDAPHDIGVSAITGISNPACQYQNSPYLNVTIKNFGYRKMLAGDTIIVGAKVNGVLQAIDTLKLPSNLLKNATLDYTFKKPVDFKANGIYTIKAFTMNGAEASFYNTNNDTTAFSFTVNPNPLTGLPDTIFTAEPDTVKLRLVKNIDYSYKWHNGSTDTTFVCTTPGYYKATVTNKNTLCVTKDSTFIKGLISDVKLDQILTPANNCGYGAPANPIIRLKNTGTDTLRVNRVIPVKYKLDGGGEVSDQVTLNRKLAPDSLIVLQMAQTMDLAAIRSYSLKMYTDLATDTIEENDTMLVNFEIYGYPSLDLGDPTIVHKDTMYKFTAPAGYSTYKWSNDSVKNTNTVKSSGWYKLTVQDSHGCPAKDSAYVFLKVRDIKPQRLVSPLTTCKNDTLSDVIFRIKNNGSDTIRTTDTVFISYQFNGGVVVADTLKPVSEILPGDSLDFRFDGQENLKATGTYAFKMEVRSAPEPDYIKENDTITYFVNVHGLPQPDIGVDVSIQALNYTVDPGIGFVSYLWQDGSTDSTYLITQDHHSVDQRYQVTVTDRYGCQNTTPKVFKVLVVPDVSVSEIVLPSTACSLSNKESITVKVKNTGNTPVNVDKIVRLKYQVNGGAFSRIDTLKLASNFNQNQVLTHTFKQLADLSAVGTKAVKVFVEYSTDVRNDNDTLTNFVKVFNRPVVSLSPNDTIIADLPYTLDAGAGFVSYAWNTGASSQTIDATVPGTYIVTVTNDSYCDASAKAYVFEKTFDLGITNVAMPDQACSLTNSETVTVNVLNTGTETLTDMPITLSYILNGGTQKSENFVFSGKAGVTQKFNFAEKIDLSEINTHTLVLSLTYANDEVSSNNELTKNILTTGAPSVVFSNEVKDTIRTNIFPYVLDAGAFTSYKWQDNTDNRVFSAPGEGWYKVTVINSATCMGSDSVYILHSTAVRNIEDKVKISIFPNPSKDNVYVDMFLDAPETINYEVISSSGRVVTNKKLSGSLQYNEIIDGLKLAKGVYYVRVYGKDWIITEKIIIQ